LPDVPAERALVQHFARQIVEPQALSKLVQVLRSVYDFPRVLADPAAGRHAGRAPEPTRVTRRLTEGEHA
ncbi:MAG: hypothetical protein ABI900_12985, partial [Betaproteobacteria bacterium]